MLAKALSSRSRKSGSRQRLQLLSAQTQQVGYNSKADSCRKCMSDCAQMDAQHIALCVARLDSAQDAGTSLSTICSRHVQAETLKMCCLSLLY